MPLDPEVLASLIKEVTATPQDEVLKLFEFADKNNAYFRIGRFPNKTDKHLRWSVMITWGASDSYSAVACDETYAGALHLLAQEIEVLS